MKLNEFRKTQNIENDYVFISDDGNVDFEDEKEFEIQEILKKENNTNCIYIQIDEFKKKEEEKKHLNEENRLKKAQKYILKCNIWGYTDFEYERKSGERRGEKTRFYLYFENGICWWLRKDGYNTVTRGYFETEYLRDEFINRGCICNYNGVKSTVAAHMV